MGHKSTCPDWRGSTVHFKMSESTTATLQSQLTTTHYKRNKERAILTAMRQDEVPAINASREERGEAE